MPLAALHERRMTSIAAAIIACCAIIVASTVLLSAATGRRPPLVPRRLKGLKSYIDAKTIKLRASIAVRDVGVEFASTGSVDPAAATSVLNGVPAEEGGYENNAWEDLHERDKIKQEPTLQYPIPDEIDEPLSNLFGTHVDPPSPLPPYSLPEVVSTVM